MTASGRGVIYIATGAAHVQAARLSAASVRASNPGLGLALFTDEAAHFREFDQVTPIENPHARSKVDLLQKSPYAETLYLDTDTRVVGDLAPAYRLLERFDLAVAHRTPDPKRLASAKPTDTPPSAYPEHNGGVIFYRATPAVQTFLDNWRSAYHRLGRTADQVTFREQLWASDIRIAILPVRYNTRSYTWLDHLTWKGAPPVVLHLNRYHPGKGGRLRQALRGLGGPR